MMIWLLRFFRGYLDIRLEGVYSEKVLSILAEKRISVWRLKYSHGSITARILCKDYKLLRSIRKNTGVKVKIVEKHGYPFFARKYKKRTGFMAGAIVFFVLLKLLSTFIWVINVEGNKKISSSEIVKTLNSIGISEGMKITDIDAKYSAQSLLLMRNDLAWASLNIEGCVLNVDVSEIKERINDDDDYPTNLVARTDGIIRKIDAVSGNVVVKVGENVHKGDVIVSGIIESLSSTVFVRSNAIITAQVEKEYSKKVGYTQEFKQKTGKISNQRIVNILGIKIPLFLAKRQPQADVTNSIRQLSLLNRKIPIRVFEKQYRYYKKDKLFFTEEELKNQLSSELKNYLESTEIEGYIPVSTEYKTEDDGVIIIHRYLCDENIAFENKIIVGQ